MTDKVTRWNLQDGGGNTQDWGGARGTPGPPPLGWVMKAREHTSRGQSRWRSAEDLVRSRREPRTYKQETQTPLQSRAKAGSQDDHPAGRAPARAPRLLLRRRAPQRRLAETPRSARLREPQQRAGARGIPRRFSTKPEGARGARPGGTFVPGGGSHLGQDAQRKLAPSLLEPRAQGDSSVQPVGGRVLLPAPGSPALEFCCL